MDPPCPARSHFIEPCDKIGGECDVCGSPAAWSVDFIYFYQPKLSEKKLLCQGCYLEFVPEDVRDEI